MGTMASVHVHDDVPGDRIGAGVHAVFAELERLEALFSTFRPDSQISQINRGERHLLDCDPEVVDVLDACTWLEHASAGAFRSRRPDAGDQLDPAGFVKGWATERAARQLTAHGLAHWYVSVGGDLVTHGAPSPGRPWNVAVADPNRHDQVVGVIELTDGSGGDVGHRSPRRTPVGRSHRRHSGDLRRGHRLRAITGVGRCAGHRSLRDGRGRTQLGRDLR